MMAAIGLMWLLIACENTGNKAIDSALWNSWPKESIGFHEDAPNRVRVAALVHRGGLRNIHDDAAFRVTVDRFIRYAADLANERKAPYFEISDPKLYVLRRDVFRGSTQIHAHRLPFVDAQVAFVKDDQAPPNTPTVLRTSDIQSAPKGQLLALPALTSLWPTGR